MSHGKKVEELMNTSRGLEPSNKRAYVKQKTHRTSWKVVQTPMLQSKIPSSGPCQFHLEENSLGAHVGNNFTCGKTHCRHSADNNLKSFSSSTLFLMYVFSVWKVWTGLWLMPVLQGGESGPSQSREAAGRKWLQELHDVSLLCQVGISYFNIFQCYFNSGMAFKSLSTFYVSADKRSLLWFRKKHEQLTSKSCIET